jgi:hypothetical protein
VPAVQPQSGAQPWSGEHSASHASQPAKHAVFVTSHAVWHAATSPPVIVQMARQSKFSFVQVSWQIVALRLQINSQNRHPDRSQVGMLVDDVVEAPGEVDVDVVDATGELEDVVAVVSFVAFGEG